MPQLEDKDICRAWVINNNTISLMAMEATTNTGKNQNFNRKVREESVEAI